MFYKSSTLASLCNYKRLIVNQHKRGNMVEQLLINTMDYAVCIYMKVFILISLHFVHKYKNCFLFILMYFDYYLGELCKVEKYI